MIIGLLRQRWGNQIIIGKIDAKSKYPVFTDKSPARTEQAISAVKQHMENLFRSSEVTGRSSEEEEHYTFNFSDGSKLAYYPPKGGSTK